MCLRFKHIKINKEGRFVMPHEQKWTKMYKQFTDAGI